MKNFIENTRCELCGSTSFQISNALTKKLTIEKPKFVIVMCKKCKLHSLYPIPSNQDLKWIYDNYAAKGNRIEVEKKRQMWVYPRKFELIKKYNPDANKILDIGAGIGGFVAAVLKEGYIVKGIELEEEQVRLGKKIFNVELCHQSFENFIKKDHDKYDVIFMHHVLEHLRFPLTVLRQIKSFMNKNSILMIEVPNQFFQLKKNIRNHIKFLNSTFKYPANPYHHIYFFSPKTLLKLLTVAGFVPLELNETGLYRLKPKIYERFLPKRLIYKLGYGWEGNLEVIARSI